MKKNKKIYFQVYEGIFNRRIHILLNYSVEEYDKWVKKLDKTYEGKANDNDFQAWSSEIIVSDQPTEWIISLKDFHWTISNQGSLIHEIVHTIIKIWAKNNIPFTPDTQEFLAHSVSNLYEDICRKCYKLGYLK